MTAPTKAPGNPFAYGKTITVDNLDELFAHHRVLTGGWSMTITPPEPGPTNPPAPTPPAPAPTPLPEFDPITSQEEFDRRLGARIAREREKYSDYDDLKQKATEFDQLQEANRSEQEKAVDAARAEGSAAERQRSHQFLVRAKAEVLAAQARFKAPDAVIASLDLSDVKVDDQGVVDVDALKAKVDAAVESGAFVIDGTTTPPPAPRPDPSQGGGGDGGGDKPGSIAEARRRAREEREAKKTPKTA